ncbi:hypothetical protein EV363DRAFT_1165424 [Boletus edulis]|uniref:Uncharacterized protein n=1 Tax=Boletus edulis BED1 TaxID=1328754 RepID=A0AAD4BPB6_BOLED|nr:hypothetical protein EV363DRAFT_1165424 [Boletus edulis]KAF8435661.1 hypothetical protein L210DRAFT_951694 [Boletus edulis BED1]
MHRAVVEVVSIPSAPSLHGFLCTGDIPTGHATIASTVLGLCTPGFFHAIMLFRQLLGLDSATTPITRHFLDVSSLAYATTTLLVLALHDIFVLSPVSFSH